MNIRQLFDKDSSTYSYLLFDSVSREAAIIDAVREQLERDVRLIEELGLTLKYALETHVHADHVTGAGALRERLGAQVVYHRASGSACADLLVSDGDLLPLGGSAVEVRHTPGHTAGDVSYVIDGAAFTGDALLIRGCGRTDFQQGNADVLYQSIKDKLFSLPDETTVYPGHDYNGFTTSTIGEEKRLNPRLGQGRDQAGFVAIMDAMDLPRPRHIDVAVPGNLRCGT